MNRVFIVEASDSDCRLMLWRAFQSEIRHQSQKELKEFEAWKQGEGVDINTPNEFIALIKEFIKKARG